MTDSASFGDIRAKLEDATTAIVLLRDVLNITTFSDHGGTDGAQVLSRHTRAVTRVGLSRMTAAFFRYALVAFHGFPRLLRDKLC